KVPRPRKLSALARFGQWEVPSSRLRTTNGSLAPHSRRSLVRGRFRLLLSLPYLIVCSLLRRRERGSVPESAPEAVMFRRAVGWSLALLVSLPVRAARAHTPGLSGPQPEPCPALFSGYLNSGLIAALARRIDFDGFADPNLTLQEALDTLAKRYDLDFEIN